MICWVMWPVVCLQVQTVGAAGNFTRCLLLIKVSAMVLNQADEKKSLQQSL